MEMEMHRQKLQHEEDQQNEMKRQNMIKKKIDESEYYNVLTLQHKAKQNKINQEKQTDKMFNQAEKLKLEKEDEERSRFFTKLK
jgi:membrane-anchored protein YejM (alkaline phosphatase superfamily)